jgi:outer membrane immunogenic protein
LARAHRRAEDDMRKCLLANMVAWSIGAALATPAIGTAAAADFYKAPPAPYVSSGYSWMGPYVGANFGYQWGDLTNSGARPSGIAGGGQAGYNWQYGQFVVGGETDLQFSDSNDVFANYKFSNPWFGTLRGRAGLAMNNILFYGTLGLAYGRGHIDLNGLSEDNMHVGWAGGGGLEVGLTQNWSVRAEYLYIDLSSEGYVLTGANNGLQSNLVRFGVNYRF